MMAHRPEAKPRDSQRLVHETKKDGLRFEHNANVTQNHAVLGLYQVSYRRAEKAPGWGTFKQS